MCSPIHMRMHYAVLAGLPVRAALAISTAAALALVYRVPVFWLLGRPALILEVRASSHSPMQHQDHVGIILSCSVCKQELVLSSSAVRAARAIRSAASLALVFWLWGRPALFLEGRALWPFTRMLTSQHAAAPGGIVAMSTIATLAIARRASLAIAALLAP